jgi:DNA-binding GntR family transcriptional regulator
VSPTPRTPFASKSDYAYDEIKQRILSEELPPGGVVSQERIASEIGVSTTPVREALKRLATEGLVRLDTHRDARVSELTSREATSLYEVRLTVDPFAASLAAQRRTDEDAALIEERLAELHPMSGKAELTALIAHREFHRAVYRASHNEPLVTMLEGLWDKADRYRQVGLQGRTSTRKDIARVQKEHRDLARAVVKGEAEAAEQVMRDHILNSLGRRAMDRLLAGDSAG